MQHDREAHGPPRCACVVALFGLACAPEVPERNDAALTVGPGLGGGATTESSGSSSDEGTSAPSDATSDAEVTTDGESSTDGPMAPKLDVGPGETGDDGCADDDVCCVQPGELPPHVLVDAFITAYPPENMPHTLAEMQTFVPAIDEAMMAYAALNTGDEIVDPDNGGLTDANIEAGRAISKTAALAAVPADAVIADIREDPPQYLDLGGAGACFGVGWAWGSILFDASDGSIGELVYLYVGYCSTDGDSEDFDYSDQATQICAAPD